MSKKKKKRYYVVVRGHQPGIYETWYGDEGAETQIRGFSNAFYKGFSDFSQAKAWAAQFDEIRHHIERFEKSRLLLKPAVMPEGSPGDPQIQIGGFRELNMPTSEKMAAPNPQASSIKHQASSIKHQASSIKHQASNIKVTLYTDGGCVGNPGPGGYGVILIYGPHRKELSGGFRLTTNNRMELMACIVGMNALNRRSSVTLHSDSMYVVNGIQKGWARRWRANDWMRYKSIPAENVDLWGQMLDLCDSHDVELIWVKGHAGHPENERCDRLAKQAASQPDLAPDVAYEGRATRVSGGRRGVSGEE